MFRINYTPLDAMMKHAIHGAVHNAVSRFSAELGDKQGLATRIAHAAAESAVEQYRAHINSELRLLEVEYERRAELSALRPPPSFIKIQTES